MDPTHHSSRSLSLVDRQHQRRVIRVHTPPCAGRQHLIWTHQTDRDFCEGPGGGAGVGARRRRRVAVATISSPAKIERHFVARERHLVAPVTRSSQFRWVGVSGVVKGAEEGGPGGEGKGEGLEEDNQAEQRPHR